MRKPVQELMECYQDQKLDITDKFVDGAAECVIFSLEVRVDS